LAIAVYNVLRRESLADVRFDEPSEVLHGLNRAFPMEENGNKFFTIWYGVYETPTRTLRYSSAGHPPALVFNGHPHRPLRLGMPSLMIGASADATFETQSEQVPPGSRLYVYSDGVSEIDKAEGGLLNVDGLVDLLAQVAKEQGSLVDRLLAAARALQGSPEFKDDFSLVEVEFD